MRVVQSFTREPVQQKAFHGVNDRYRAANYETTVLNAIYFPAVDLLATAATAIVFGYGGWLVYHGEMTAGTLFAFALYLSNFFDPIQQLSQLYNTFLSAIAALDKIIGVLDEEPQVVDPRRGRVAGAGSTAASTSRTSASATARSSPRSCTGSSSTCPPGRPWRSSGTRAPASRRSRS